MTHPAWLIAVREFRTYVATTSFWVALALGPILMGGGLLLASNLPKPPPRSTLTLEAGEAGVRAVFSRDFPLSDTARRQVVDVIARDGRTTVPVTLAAPEKAKLDVAALSRFSMVMMLWLILVGSLGMLLQAVVRERTNRALESLLAAARPVDIVLGKLAGVGAVSALALGAWLGSAAGLGSIAPEAGGAASALLRGLADPQGLARAVVIYLFGFGFYGLVTVAIGAMARDTSDAQNLARPMFLVLLTVFFTVLAMTSGAGEHLAWLVYVPPFTPFLLLVSPQPGGVEVVAIGGLIIATLGAGLWATRVLRVERMSIGSRFRRRARA
jgi:ABC-2 type transport system permease protein